MLSVEAISTISSTTAFGDTSAITGSSGIIPFGVFLFGDGCTFVTLTWLIPYGQIVWAVGARKTASYFQIECVMDNLFIS